MSTIRNREPVRVSELMPIAQVLLHRNAGLDERLAITRSGEREPIRPVIRQLVHRRDNWRCLWCGASPWAHDKDRRCSVLHLDHITPWSAGGTDRSDNLRTLCDSCNSWRSNYRTDMQVSAVLPVVGICDPCRRVESKPAEVIEAYCGCRSHDSWVVDGARIL